MKVFVTGATGFIGSAVVRELHAVGHQVLGLARSDSAEAMLAAADVEVQRGSLDDLDSLRRAAAASDGVIHLAYHHDFSEYQRAAQMDLNAVEAIGAALTGTGKPFVIPTGTAMLTFFLPPGQVGTEEDLAPAGMQAPRIMSENAMLALAQHGVRTSVIRLAPTVHGEGDHGFVATLIQIARAKGVSAYIGDGSNRWPVVHRLEISTFRTDTGR
jgi:nucleoside-diphosphate-sugar epimerase